MRFFNIPECHVARDFFSISFLSLVYFSSTVRPLFRTWLPVSSILAILDIFLKKINKKSIIKSVYIYKFIEIEKKVLKILTIYSTN